jgi:hypothetical protein
MQPRRINVRQNVRDESNNEEHTGAVNDLPVKLLGLSNRQACRPDFIWIIHLLYLPERRTNHFVLNPRVGFPAPQIRDALASRRGSVLLFILDDLTARVVPQLCACQSHTAPSKDELDQSGFRVQALDGAHQT